MDNDQDNTQTHIVLTKGTMVSHYRIIDKIGAGGMGEVYLAEDTTLKRKVALKFLPSHLCQDDDCRTRFKREAQAAAKLSHPNIIHVYEVSEYQGRPFFAMEHVEGLSLREHASGKELSIEQILELGIQICEGLHDAHEKGITHRDIKPSNILIDSHGRAKIVDFGLASVIGSDQLTKTGSTLGTIGYMSPEQVQGREVDHRSDLFSFGVVFYELITKRNPFKRDSEAATLKAVSDDTPEPLARYKSDVPDGIQAIIEKLLSKNRVVRYQHADEILADLKREQEGISWPSRSAATLAPAVTRPGWAWPVSSAVMIVIAIIATYVLLGEQPSERRVAQRKQLTFRGNVHQPEISPDGRHIAFVERRPDRQSRVIVVQDLVGGAPVEIFEDRLIFGIRWSPDGNELLAFAYNDSIPGVVLVPRSGGSVRRYRLSGQPFAWSPEGDQFALHDYLRDRVLFVDRRSGDTLPKGFEAKVWDMDWSPNGELLAISDATGADFVLSIYSLVEGKWIRQERPIVVDRVRWSRSGDAIYFLKPKGQTYVIPPDLMKISIDPHSGEVRGEPTVLVSGLQTGGGGFSFSRDRRKLVYRKSMRWSNLWMVQLDGTADVSNSAIQLTFGTSQVWDPSISPDGTRVAFAGKTQDEVHIFTLPIEGGDPTQVTHTNSPNWSPAWSPDVRQIAYSTFDGFNHRVSVIDPLGGAPRVLEQSTPPNDYGSVVWSPGDRILYLNTTNCSLLDPETGDEEPLFEHNLAGWAHRPRYSPDGRRIAVKTYEHVDDVPGQVWNKQEISVYSADDHQKLWSMTQDEFGGMLIGWSPDGRWLYRMTDRNDSSGISRVRIEDGKTQDIIILPWSQVSEVVMSSNCSTFVCVIDEGQFDAWLIEDCDPDVK